MEAERAAVSRWRAIAAEDVPRVNALLRKAGLTPLALDQEEPVQ